MKKFLKFIKHGIKDTSLFKRFKTTSLYRKHLWYYSFKHSWKRALLHEAIQEFTSGGGISNYLLGDYKKALKTNLVSYSEYMHQYRFPKLTEEQRKEYVSRLEMRLWYERNSNSVYVENLFWNKANWLKHFNEFIHRDWFYPKELTYHSFMSQLKRDQEYIIKPAEGSLGEGIYKIEGKDLTEDLFEKLKENNCIVEELVANESQIAAFHPHSLNTIRVMSLSTGEIVGSFIRFGNNGNVVDNAHAGGIFAQIDVETGKIATDGIDTDGNTYAEHPFSGKTIKGFQIPKWDEIKDMLKKLHDAVPQALIVGWDFSITDHDVIEVIEGNHLPDVDLIQSPQKQGIRKRINKLLLEANFPQLG